MGEGPPKRRTARVPDGRAERLGRLGSLLAGIAGDAALEGIRRVARRVEGDREGATPPDSLLLTQATARRLTDTLSEMRGAALKLGQLLSIQGDDLLPGEFANVLARLRSQADFMPESQVHGVLERELGPDWEARFVEFDFEPIAAASIGQVHGAEAADGRDLAIKLQYPGVSRSIASDVRNLGVLLRLTRLLPPELATDETLRELERELRREADYRREARNTERYRMLVADDPTVFVPRVHEDLSTRTLLATDRVRALPIEDLRSPEHLQSRRDRVGERLIGLVLRELFVFRFMQTDPNFANYLFDPKEERVALLDFGAARTFGARFVGRYRDLIEAALGGGDTDVVRAAEVVGFLQGDDPAPTIEAFVAIARLFAEPLGARGRYDFATSDLAQRVREHGLSAYAAGQVRRAPAEVLFLHRKLVGSFLLCAHIGARVDCGELYARI